jgi:uncharacterized protein with von Willebrand factor type A (vWA) domain
MTDLSALFAEKPPDSDGVATKASTKPIVGSPFVFDLDLWGELKGERLAYEEWNNESDHLPSLLGDCHHSLFSPSPRFAELPMDAERAAWFRQLLDTPEYAALHAQTCLVDWLSDLACKSIADQWSQYASTLPEPQPGDPEPGSDAEDIGKVVKRISSTQKAAKEAAEIAKEAGDSADALGLSAGTGRGEIGSVNEAKIAETFQRVRGNDKLRHIIQLAGRNIRFAAAMQRRKVKHGADDVVGVEVSDDLERVLPSELLGLHVPALRLETLRRISEGEVFCQQYRGIEKVGKGPIIVLVDESGSMQLKDRIIQAKALALTMGWIARHQRRWIAFASFSSEWEQMAFAMPPNHWDQAALMDWLSHYYDGGTSLHALCDTLPNEWWQSFREQGMPEGKTDVLLITDGIVPISNKLKEQFLAWKQTSKAKLYSIVLEANPGVLKAISDQFWVAKDLSLDDDSVKTVLAV